MVKTSKLSEEEPASIVSASMFPLMVFASPAVEIHVAKPIEVHMSMVKRATNATRILFLLLIVFPLMCFLSI